MKNQKNYSRLIFAALVIFGAFYVNSVCADVIYQESGGMVVGEGELFSERTNDGSGNGWFAVPDENAGAGSFTNARGGAYIQSLPDNGSGGGPIVPPEVMYKMHIFSPGSYRLYIRWECNMSVGDGGNSDSIFCDIVELKDGVNPATYYSPTNQIADWYELAGADDGDFATNPWRSWGQAEINNAGGSGDNADWVITTQGVYTLRFTQREDGSAVDAFVFQKSDLPAPTGYGPAMSSLEQSRIVSEASDDTYLRRNDTNALHGAETSMLVKNDTSASAAGYDRFTYLRFDISELSLFEDAVPTNATMQIYLMNEGINTNHDIFVAVIAEDATAEHFDEMTLWPSADPPSNNDVFSGANDEGIDWSRIYGGAAVGSFEISSTNENQTINFSSPAFLKAISDDTDGVLSMVLYRTMDNSNTDQFASKEHDTYPPPTVEVNFWFLDRGTMIMVR